MILQYKDNIKKTRQTMKEVNGKDKLINNSLTKHLILNNRNTFGQKTIANSFNEYLTETEIPQSQKLLEMYLKESDSSFDKVNLSDEEIKTTFFYLKWGKSPGFDEINFDIASKMLTPYDFR